MNSMYQYEDYGPLSVLITSSTSVYYAGWADGIADIYYYDDFDYDYYAFINTVEYSKTCF